jgi:hypothetical protein
MHATNLPHVSSRGFLRYRHTNCEAHHCIFSSVPSLLHVLRPAICNWSSKPLRFGTNFEKSPSDSTAQSSDVGSVIMHFYSLCLPADL